MSRNDYLYVCLDKSLLKIVDTCVSNIFSNGSQVYSSRRDFITKSIQYQIDKEKLNNQSLENKIRKSVIEVKHVIGGNRIVTNK
jgi:hypothetical protein